MKKSIYLIFLIALLFSCQKEDHTPKLGDCISGEIGLLIDPDGVDDSGDEYNIFVYPTPLSGPNPWDSGDSLIDIDGLENHLDENSALSDFDGLKNTAKIVAQLASSSGTPGKSNLAKRCTELSNKSGCEWYLPSLGELMAIAEKIGIEPGQSWSSSEHNAEKAWQKDGSAVRTRRKNWDEISCRCIRR